MKRTVSLLILLIAILMATVACDNGPFVETFDDSGTWGSGVEDEVSGNVAQGVYRMMVDAESGIFWSTANKDFADGVYEVEATQTAGPLDNGYGMMFMMDTDADNFYLFEVSGDGFIWIGRCSSSCEEDIVYLVGNGWFESSTVNQGIDNTNRLRVDVAVGEMVFYVNDQEVGRAFDDTLTTGDIGIMVETLGEGGVVVEFDNFQFTPAGTDG